MNKQFFIAEIGLNHLGSQTYCKYYLKHLLKSKIDGISFQIKKDTWHEEYYKSFKKKDYNFCHKIRDGQFFANLIKNNNFIRLKLSKKFYTYVIKLCKKKGKLIGFALSNKKDLNFLIKSKVDFIKILNEDFNDTKFINSILKSDIKKVIISVGNKKLHEISKLLSLLKYNKKIILTYTEFLKDQPDFKNLTRLKKYNLKYGYGNHSKNIKNIKNCLKYNPDYLLFYVKGKKKFFHPDEHHSVRVNEVNSYTRY